MSLLGLFSSFVDIKASEFIHKFYYIAWQIASRKFCKIHSHMNSQREIMHYWAVLCTTRIMQANLKELSSWFTFVILPGFSYRLVDYFYAMITCALTARKSIEVWKNVCRHVSTLSMKLFLIVTLCSYWRVKRYPWIELGKRMLQVTTSKAILETLLTV